MLTKLRWPLGTTPSQQRPHRVRTVQAVAYKGGSSTASPKTAQEPNRVLKASLDTILSSYYERTPSAAQVIQKVYKEGYGEDQVFHDHFAFRTFGVPGLGIEPLGAALEAFGYTLRDYYTFPRTHLLAAWYAPPKDLYEVLPRMFVSQLQVQKLSSAAQAIIHSYTDELTTTQSSIPQAPQPPSSTAATETPGHSSSAGAASSSRSAAMGSSSMAAGLSAWTAAVTQTLPWRAPRREDYMTLLEETEYGAWVLVNGYALNHTALSVHKIAGRQGDIYGFANELVMKGFKMNETGGIMKVSPDSGLLQCSTVADLVDFRFDDGQVHPVVGAYMEVAERKVLPQHQHLAASGGAREQHRRDGFEAQSATNIFASTTVAATAAQQRGVL